MFEKIEYSFNVVENKHDEEGMRTGWSVIPIWTKAYEMSPNHPVPAVGTLVWPEGSGGGYLVSAVDYNFDAKTIFVHLKAEIANEHHQKALKSRRK